ncbi:Moa, A lectin from the mushroom marasmius Oreades in complex with the trisaccharide Galgalglcnac [Amylostereum chailletii]|nr:Moa, A lectin from the mushroom marasmius Oreades in complex with the trisaccharide Galgalglcnac [Amylostereum chailletii]
MPSFARGVYFMQNIKAPVFVALSEGSKVIGWQKFPWDDTPATTDNKVFSHLWLIDPVTGKDDTFTLRNLMGGTYLSLPGANATNGTLIVGGSPNSAQEIQWIIKAPTGGQAGTFKIQHAVAKTFVDLYGGGSTNGTAINGWAGDWNIAGNANQNWVFERVSRTSGEIKTAVLANPDISTDFKSFLADSDYLLLPRGFWQNIWNSSDLKNRRWRSEIFDCDDFATVEPTFCIIPVFKAEVAKWGDTNIKADNISVLCGLMYGTSDRGGHAYNFAIMSNTPNKVVFFEPQTNSFMDSIGFKAYFGMFCQI